MKNPPIWDEPRLRAEADKAVTLFRSERLDEPVTVWRKTFNEYQIQFETLFDKYGADSPEQMDTTQIAEVFRNDLGDALRYLAGPPISEDDLKILANASLAPSKIEANNDAARRILETIIRGFDFKRFPWVADRRLPTDSERCAAILASTALITAQRVSTKRRNEGKNKQEGAVKDFLQSIGFTEVGPRHITTLTDAPDKGEFCSECLVGSRKADVPVRLLDGRLMPIECKVSNSSTNSVKRLNNDAAAKAVTWREEFGRNQVVPVAVLSGVFNVRNLLQAQERGLTIFWAHDLHEISVFLETA